MTSQMMTRCASAEPGADQAANGQEGERAVQWGRRLSFVCRRLKSSIWGAVLGGWLGACASPSVYLVGVVVVVFLTSAE
jgi:hypothetical protein